MILKYTLRLIKSTFNRFIAILAIVFIGVSFMMGLRSNYNIMQNSVEDYFDNQDLYDIQVYSDFGFDGDDINAIKKLDYVDDVYASKTRDVYCYDPAGSEYVVRLLEIDNNLNKYELKEGRLPSKENECLAIIGYTSAFLKLGDKVNLFLKDSEVSDIVSNTEFTVVGFVKASEYMTETFTVSLLDNRELDAVLYIPNSNFVTDYYISVYAKLKDAKNMFSFSKEYENYVDGALDKFEDFASVQSQALKDKYLNEAIEKIEQGKTELEENKAKYEKEIIDGKKKLDDAKVQLDEAKKQIEQGEIEIPKGEQELIDGQAKVDAGRVELEQAERELNQALSQVERYGLGVDELYNQIYNLYGTYNNAKRNIESLNNKKQQYQQELESYRSLTSGYSSLSEVRSLMATVDPSSEEYARLRQAYDAFVYLDTYDYRIEEIDAEIDILQQTVDNVESTMQSQFSMGTEEGYNYATDLLNQVKDGQAQINKARGEIENGQELINQNKVKLEQAKKQLAQGKIDYAKGLEEYEKGLVEYEEGKNKFELEIQNAQDQIDDAESQINQYKESGGWHVLARHNSNYAYIMYKNTCEQMKSIGTIIPLLFFIVAALVCSTTMTRLIDEQRGQIGIYRALGFRKGEVISIYLLYVIIASLVASIVAVVAGVYLFPAIIYNTWRMMYDLPQIIISMPKDNIIICISSFTILMMLVTFIVIANSLKENSAQLLRPKAPKSSKKLFIENWHWLWNKLPFTSKVTARNILRYKGRFIMTVIGIAGCTSLLLLGFGIKDSISSVVSLQYGEIEKYEYYIDIKDDRHIDQILDDIRVDQKFEISVVPYCTYRSEVIMNNESKAIGVRVVEDVYQKELYSIFDHKTGEQIALSKNGACISSKFAKDNNVKVGDTFEFNSQLGTHGKVIIDAIVDNYVDENIFMTLEAYKKAFNEDVEYTTIGVSHVSNPERLLSLADKYNDINVIEDIASLSEVFVSLMDALNLIIIVIIIVAGALAFVVLINLTNVNISERIREIATLKVLGFRQNEVNSYIFKEIMLMSIIGALIGLPLGVIEARYILDVIDMEGVTFPHIVHPISYGYSFAITIIFTIIVLLLTIRTLKKIEMVESLKSIE